MYFATYNQVQQQMEQLSTSRTTNSLLAGGLSGIAFWFVAYPFDVLKAKQMVSPIRTSLSETAGKVYRDSGLKGFTRGFTPCVLRAFPANAAAFFGFEAAMNLLTK